MTVDDKGQDEWQRKSRIGHVASEHIAMWDNLSMRLLTQPVRGTISHQRRTSVHIADRLESELNNLGESVSVHAQDFPDKGRGSWEKDFSGGRIYLNRDESRGQTINKGITIQSKWDDSTDRAGLAEQVGRKKKRTKSSYVWLYGPSSITVVPSSDVHACRLNCSHATTIGTLITESLRCLEADPRLGRNLIAPVSQARTALTEQLTVPTGLSLTLTDVHS